jgi:GTP-binding protein Era
MTSNRKCSFIAVVGAPNAGKSTLVNTIVGEKVSIVSPKIQTTRKRIRGIVEIDETQLVFTDTPGFCKSSSHLEKAIMANFRKSYKDADLILLIVDATSRHHNDSFEFIEKIQKSDVPLVVAINKVDIVKKLDILVMAEKLSQYDFIRKIFMVSATQNDGVDDLKTFLKESASCGPWLFGENQATDTNLSFRLSEITREKIFNRLDKELPYSIYVETELFKNTEKKAKIYQSIVVLKDSQKGIVLGRQGSMIKSIREDAVFDMKNLLDKKVELKLFVKAKEKWTEKKAHLQSAGIIE